MSFKRIAKITIAGEVWELGYGFPGKRNGKVNDGLCSWERRRITIQRKSLGRSRSLAEVLAHEIAHAAMPALAEDYAEIIGDVVGKAYAAFEPYEKQ